ncbi:hypothetical protein A4X13_0g7907 [Tilletia indica]|uniref:Core-binding (CB) domain-containing protein n=1 Tax=Tilletia indica TaxID=43049 RepID=A0A8T8SH39_9BASI|nr:hypothetical protein A4X13_0g7907 [Tilletia indica]
MSAQGEVPTNEISDGLQQLRAEETGQANPTQPGGGTGLPPVSHRSRLAFNPSATSSVSPIIYPFPRCPFPIPADLYELYRAGHSVPLCLLTIAGCALYGKKERPPFKLPLDPVDERRLDEWMAVDAFIPFSEWAQASTALFAIMDQSDDTKELGISDGSVYGGHILAVIAAHHGNNWDILREYDIRVREEIAKVRRSNSSMPFDITKLHMPELDMASGVVRNDGASFVDLPTVNSSRWARLLALPHQDRKRFHASWNIPIPVQAPAQTVSASTSASTSTSVSPKRKVARQSFPVAFGQPGPSSAFQSSASANSSAPGGSSKPFQHMASWCAICCSYATHRWRFCLYPAAGSSLYRNGAGWQFHGQSKLVCINFNSGIACGSGRPHGASAGSGLTGPCIYVLPQPVFPVLHQVLAPNQLLPTPSPTTLNQQDSIQLPANPILSPLEDTTVPTARTPIFPSNSDHAVARSVHDAYRTIVTPLQHEEWSIAIAELPPVLQEEYATIPTQIKFGFWLGLPPPPAIMFHPPNRLSAHEIPVVEEWISSEVNRGRAFGPYSDEEMAAVGPWRCAPLSVIHTPATSEKPAKNRVVEDLGHPRFQNSRPNCPQSRLAAAVPSVNSLVPDKTFYCRWFPVYAQMELYRSLPPSADVMGMDIQDAFYNLSPHPSQRPHLPITVLPSRRPPALRGPVSQTRLQAPPARSRRGVSRPAGRFAPSAPPLSSALAYEVPREDVLLFVGPLPDRISPRFSTLNPDHRWRLQVSIAASVGRTTLQNYGSAIRAFLLWCEEEAVAIEARLPCSETLLLHFFSNHLDSLRATTQSTRRAALQLWHDIHGFDFKFDGATASRLSQAAKRLQTEPVPPRRPLDVEDLRAIRSGLSTIARNKAAAIWACVVFGFFSLARIGELTAEKLSDPRDATQRALRNNWSFRPAEGAAVSTMTLHLPRDKVNTRGTGLIAAAQPASLDVCPVEAVRWHLQVNSSVPAQYGALAYGDVGGGVRELTAAECLKEVNAALASAGRPPISGHCLRIGGATFFLTSGVPEQEIRRHGRWGSDAHLLYLRRLHVAAGRAFGNLVHAPQPGS